MRRIVTVGVLTALLVGSGAFGFTGPDSTADLETIAVDTEPGTDPEVHVSEVFAASGDMVGAVWDSGSPDHVEVRSLRDGAWTEWLSLVHDDEHAPDPWTSEAVRSVPGTEPTAFKGSEAVQFRVTGGVVEGLEAVFVDIEERALLPRVAAADAAPAIQPRSSWDPDNACVPRETPEEIQVNTAILHHTGYDRSYSRSAVPGMILGYCLYHRNSRGWDDIAYNFLIDEYGTIWEGRAGGIDKGIRGGHTSGFSSYSTGIALIGNYTREYPTQAQQNALFDLLAWKFEVHNIEPTSSSVVISLGSYKWDEGVAVTMPALSGHRDAQATSCPGSYCYSRFDQYREIVSGRFSAWPIETYGPVAFGDFNGDGVEDGAAYATDAGSWSVFDGSAGAESTWDDGEAGNFDVAVGADLDGDGIDDIIAAAPGQIHELRSTGTGFVSSGQAVDGIPLRILRATDDGSEMTVAVMTNGAIRVAPGYGAVASIASPVDAATGDLDGDGTDEVIVLDSSGVVHVASLDGASGMHGASSAAGSSDRVVVADFLGDGSDSIAAVDMSGGVATLLVRSGSGLEFSDSLDFSTRDHLTEVFADTSGPNTRLLAVDALVGQWKAASFSGPVPAVTMLADQAWRTHVVRSQNVTSSPFVAWYGREFGWMQSQIGFNGDEDANATVNLAGANRFATNVALSRLVNDSTDRVVLATSERFPDALTAGVVAAMTDAALLLTEADSLPTTIRNEIVRLGASRVTIAGGPMAVSLAVEAELVDLGLVVERIGGADRYETAVMLSQATFDRAETVYIATGRNYPDALAAVPVAGHRAAPVLLVSDQLPVVVAAELARLAPSEIVILGGPAAVPESVEDEIQATTGITPSRLGGADRNETAIRVSRSTFDASTDVVFVTKGEGFIDAIVAGPVADRLDAPLLLTWGEASGSLLAEIERLRPNSIILIGGGLANDDSIDSFDGVGPSLSTETVAYAPRP